ncbi:MAG: hypothetical protein ACHQ9S_14250 [Candidatus Binatia bacterium]
MKKVSCVLVLLLAAVIAAPVWAAELVPVGEEPASQVTETTPGYTPDAGASLLAALTNIVYFPLRLTITLVTAEVGGFAGWITGGDKAAAQAVWQSTDGQAYIRPEVLEGRERLRFGRWQ